MLCGTTSGVCANSPPPLSKADYPLVDDFAYSEAKVAQDAWRAMSGTASVTVVQTGHSRMLKMPCRFNGTKTERASWDRQVKLDLTACRGIQFLFFSPDSSPVSHCSLYLRSGHGWYAFSFGQTVRGGWTTVLIDKSDAVMEERPGGWGSIDAIRISAWRGKDVGFCLSTLPCRLG